MGGRRPFPRRRVEAAPTTPLLQIGDLGIDVASYQGFPNWAAVADDGIRFAITKCSEGTNYLNPTFLHNWTGIRNAGLVRGAYHYARPDLGGPQAEAQSFFRKLGPLETDDILALDIETGNGNLREWVVAWLNECERLAGRKAYLYSGMWFMLPHGLVHADVAAASGGLWLAAYQPAPPLVPEPWGGSGQPFIWQRSSTASVSGIAGNVDQNVYLGLI